MSRKRREFVRVLHSNAEGQPRSKIKPSKKKGKKWEILPGDPCDSRDIDPTGDRPYRYRPRGHVGCTTGEIKGFLRSACGTMCAENFHVGFHYIYSENTGRPDGRQTGWSASLCERYAGKGLSRLFPIEGEKEEKKKGAGTGGPASLGRMLNSGDKMHLLLHHGCRGADHLTGSTLDYEVTQSPPYPSRLVMTVISADDESDDNNDDGDGRNSGLAWITRCVRDEPGAVSRGESIGVPARARAVINFQKIYCPTNRPIVMCEPRENVPASAVKNGRTISAAAMGREKLRDAGGGGDGDRGAVCSLPSRKLHGRSGGGRGKSHIRGARTMSFPLFPGFKSNWIEKYLREEGKCGEIREHRVCVPSAPGTNANTTDPPPIVTTTIAVTIVITEVAINHIDEEEPSRAKTLWRSR
ncbi:hypothetical protein ALC60_13857 [Trachymyrmex zeteki]|uniref:Uncharacterized protein n=1 Tax=Mycetomoellerius zeteki TaxID=64791 RepID=A0A151WGZ8_9HYME|nr:hypothetical protein ALC60_13857 [Trachymyrmex zeteki]